MKTAECAHPSRYISASVTAYFGCQWQV